MASFLGSTAYRGASLLQGSSPFRSTAYTCSSASQHRYPSNSQQRLASSSASSSSASPLSFPSHLSNPSPYDIFHLPRSSQPHEVKSRYYDLVKTLHPDRRLARQRSGRQSRDQHSSVHDRKGKLKASTFSAALSEEERAKEEFRLVVKAYQLLSDRDKRARYDRLGVGWDGSSSSASSSSNPWGASDAEWMELRRRANAAGWPTGNPSGGAFHGWNSQQGHDTYGWQRYAQASSDFYARSSGPRPSPHGSSFSFDPNFTPPRAQPRYASNKRFISIVALVTWTLALFQFHRLSNQSAAAVTMADKRHLDAVRNLDEARVQAKSAEGRQRLEALRRRAREERVVKEIGDGSAMQSTPRPPMLPAPSSGAAEENPWGVGHGGPSGRAQHDDKRRAAEARTGAGASV
ncbi:DnaJ-domain-containing protein [Jaminaea rosea]|uniref:DnaJ-domain-containing protein n=1 Tax=Jaminaea rosea TaxID=1569628 RepID=A0A316UW53_9BASI|nr:DnaJ-domain-containing protein [Jaminaea rosea]PWN29028.1 DnaJ-domain-containing protein [Jaminaea rosea]